MMHANQADFGQAGIQELSVEEMFAVSGAQKSTAERVTDWGSSAMTSGAAMAGAGALVTQADSPLPGPADVAGVAMVGAGLATAAVGFVAFVGGSIAQAAGG